MVYAPQPGALVEWLREIFRPKPPPSSTAPSAVTKHAKTECYREHLRFMAQTDESFIVAPGVKGMVIWCFTLPGSDRVLR